MNITIESLLADAKTLVGRLKDDDTAAEGLAEQASSLHKSLESKNTYNENLKDLSKVSGRPAKSTFIMGMQKENQLITKLQFENDGLRQSLTDHQSALELIMTKYRHQMVQFMNNKNLLQVFPANGRFSPEEKHDLVKTQILMDKVYEMASVMQKAIHLDEDSCQAQQEYISRLEAENQGLRDLLLITNGQLGSRLISKTPKTSTCGDIGPEPLCEKEDGEDATFQADGNLT